MGSGASKSSEYPVAPLARNDFEALCKTRGVDWSKDAQQKTFAAIDRDEDDHISQADLDKFLRSLLRLTGAHDSFGNLLQTLVEVAVKDGLTETDAESAWRHATVQFGSSPGSKPVKLPHAEEDESLLPKELKGFIPLGKEPKIVNAVQPLEDLESRLLADPTPGGAAAEALGGALKHAEGVLVERISARISEEGIVPHCDLVVKAGGHHFVGVYDQVWGTVEATQVSRGCVCCCVLAPAADQNG